MDKSWKVASLMQDLQYARDPKERKRIESEISQIVGDSSKKAEIQEAEEIETNEGMTESEDESEEEEETDTTGAEEPVDDSGMMDDDVTDDIEEEDLASALKKAEKGQNVKPATQIKTTASAKEEPWHSIGPMYKEYGKATSVTSTGRSNTEGYPIFENAYDMATWPSRTLGGAAAATVIGTKNVINRTSVGLDALGGKVKNELKTFWNNIF